MTQHCCIKTCKHSKRTSSCTYKRFPSDPQKSKLWETIVRRSLGSRASEWKRAAWDRICECHFAEDQFERNRQDGFRKLRWDAVPSLFGSEAKPPSHRPLTASKKMSSSESESLKSGSGIIPKGQAETSNMSSNEALLINEDLQENDAQISDEQLELSITSNTEESVISDAGSNSDEIAVTLTASDNVLSVEPMDDATASVPISADNSEQCGTEYASVVTQNLEDSVCLENASEFELCQEATSEAGLKEEDLNNSNLNEEALTEDYEDTASGLDGVDADYEQEEIEGDGDVEYEEQQPCNTIQNVNISEQNLLEAGLDDEVDEASKSEELLYDDNFVGKDLAAAPLQEGEGEPPLSIQTYSEEVEENQSLIDQTQEENDHSNAICLADHEQTQSHQTNSEEDINQLPLSPEAFEYSEGNEEVKEEGLESENCEANPDEQFHVIHEGEDDAGNEVDEIGSENDGEEFLGEEEEFDDGEDMGEEVEVEIEDCSDAEMDQNGGVTYIITEGMIVVEENESSENFTTADAAASVEEDPQSCDDQGGNLHKMKRIVIKVPSSKSLNNVEYSVDSEETAVEETVGQDVEPEETVLSNSDLEKTDQPASDQNLDIDAVTGDMETNAVGGHSVNLESELLHGAVNTLPFNGNSAETKEDDSVDMGAADIETVAEKSSETECIDEEQPRVQKEATHLISEEGSAEKISNEPEQQRTEVFVLNSVETTSTIFTGHKTKSTKTQKELEKCSVSQESTLELRSNEKDASGKVTEEHSVQETKEPSGGLSKQVLNEHQKDVSKKPFKESSKTHSKDSSHNKESKKEPKVDTGKAKDKAAEKQISKQTPNSLLKQRKHDGTSNVDKGPASSKSNKLDSVSKSEQGSKPDLVKKLGETKDMSTRSSLSGNHHSSKKPLSTKQHNAVNQRTRSNSFTGKDSSGKDKGTAKREEGSSKKSSLSDDSPSSSKPVSEGKVALRSSRSRKAHTETSTDTSDSQESVQKKDKVKSVVDSPRPRHSERVCKATEKALASGLSSRRRGVPVESNLSNTEKPEDPEQEEVVAPQRRGKRKADLSPPVEKGESKRRTTRSSDNPSSNETPATPSHSLRSVRKGKALKRKSSSSHSPPAKHAHTIKTSAKDRAEEAFIANIPKMCRICGSKNDNLLNVFGPEGRTMKLSDKVHSILPIKMKEDEPLPSGVCHSCVVTLIACEKLVEKCSHIDRRLRAHFNCPVEQQSKEKINQQHEVPSTKPSKSDKIVLKTAAVTTAESSDTNNDESLTTKSKPIAVTRTSSRVSAKRKLTEDAQKPENATEKTPPSVDVNNSPVTVKKNVSASPDVEDAPPVLEAEPPQSHLSASNQEPSAQPPVLVPQPGKPLPELVPIPGEDPTNASKQRFGNTYRARMKPGQWEKIERGLEAIHGEQLEDDMDQSAEAKPIAELQAEEFHIVDLDMNVEEVASGAPKDGTAEIHVEIPTEAVEEETTAQPSSPKSVIDSILVDWSGDEDDVAPEQRANQVASHQLLNTAGSVRDGLNGSSSSQSSTAVKTPCLFGDDDEGDVTSRVKSNATLVVVKQESFWPDPAPGVSTAATPESDVPWKCSVCGKRGKSLSKFLEHKKLHLNDRKLVSCPKCSESFSNMGLLKSHMKAHHGDDDEDEVVVERQTRQTRQRNTTVVAPEETVVDVDLTPASDGLYHCSVCQTTFTNIESLCQHKLIHQKNENTAVYKCTVCRTAFFQMKDYQEHLLNHHRPSSQNVGKFQCAKCDLKFLSQKEFLEHIRTHPSEQESFSCDMCNKIFDTKHKLRSHRSTVHKSTAYACHLCDKVCQKRITLIEHLRKHTGDNPFACGVCNKRFNRLANYKAHMTIHENARRFECPYCGKRFNRQSIQQRHIKTHTNEQSRKHRCRVCNLTFNVATEMYTHRRLHTRDEVERANWEDEKQRMALTSFPCKVCAMPFNSVEDVLAHMPFHTDDERDIAVKLKNPRLECDICGKILNSKRTFNAHRSSHIDGKPFVCKICSKGYSTNTGLNYHMLSHTGERPFPCTFCNKGYKNSTDLKVHMRQHTGEFPYKCNLCNKAFRSASSLQKHGYVHTESRPFQCQFCSLTFKREGTMKNHERIHNNDRRFKCKICSRAFVHKASCDAHEKLHFRGGTQLHLSVSDGIADSQKYELEVQETNTATTSVSEKHDIYDDFEEEEFDEDDDDEDEYIIYEDDSMEDGENDVKDEEVLEMTAADSQNDANDPLKSDLDSLGKTSSNGVDLPAISITPIPVTVTGDTIPSVGDSSVHITIL